MQKLMHGWADLGTYAYHHQVASPTGGIMNSLGNIGTPEEEIRVGRTGEDAIEVLNIDRCEQYPIDGTSMAEARQKGLHLTLQLQLLRKRDTESHFEENGSLASERVRAANPYRELKEYSICFMTNFHSW